MSSIRDHTDTGFGFHNSQTAAKNRCFRTRIMLAAQNRILLDAQTNLEKTKMNKIVQKTDPNNDGSVPENCFPHRNLIPEELFERILQNYVGGSELDFSGFDLGYNGIVFLMDLDLTNVTNLSLRECNLDAKALRLVCSFVSRAKKVTTMDLSGNKIAQNGVECIRDLSNSRLDVLKLNHNGLNDDDFSTLVEILPVALRELDLGYNLLGFLSGIVFSRFLPENRTLRSLDLSHNHLGAEGAKNMLQGLKENTSVEKLDVSWNSLEDEGAVYVAEFVSRAFCLKELALNGNFISATGAACLAQSLRENSSLEVLEIGQNFLKNAGACSLLRSIRINGSSRVRLLDLNGTVVEKEFSTVYRKMLLDNNSTFEVKGFCVM